MRLTFGVSVVMPLSGRWGSLAAAVGLAGALAGVLPAVVHADPPPGRAYELVSPADDRSGSPAGVATDANALPGFAGQDGTTMVFGAPGPIGSAINGAPNPLVFAMRDPDTGWSAETVTRTGDGGETGLNFSAGEPTNATVSSDARSVTFGIQSPLLPEAVGPGVYAVTQGDPMPEWLSRPGGSVAAAAGVRGDAISTPDLRTTAFSSTAPLTSDSPPSGGVYAFRDGVLELASVLPDGTPAVGAPRIANGGSSSAGTSGDLPAVRNKNMLTPDGRFLLFRNDEFQSAYSLYVRDLEDGVTRPLAVRPAGVWRLGDSLGGKMAVSNRAGIHDSLAVVAAEAPVAYFRGDGSVVGPADGARFFEANLETGDVQHRPALSGPPVGVSPDGTKVLFLKMPASSGSDPIELRLWDSATPATSVLLGSIPRTNNGAGTTLGGVIRFVRSANEGQTWTFAASGSLDPTHPNLKPTALQVYRWDVGDSNPTCLSCSPTDSVARFLGVNMGVSETQSSETVRKQNGAHNTIRPVVSAVPSRTTTDDGQIIAFDSPDRLTADDTNNIRDVYLWDAEAPAGEELQLVTSGQGTAPSYFLDMDKDGRTVFFATADGLVPADGDGAYDVYAARVGGGFPDVPDTSCGGEDTCRPANIAPPTLAVPGSDVVSPPTGGAQQPVQTGTPKLRVRSLRTSSRWVQVRVDTPGAGRIRVSGSRVRTANRSAKRATTYSLRVPLTSAARRSVDRGKSVKVSLRVQFTPEGSKKAQRVSSSVSVKKGR